MFAPADLVTNMGSTPWNGLRNPHRTPVIGAESLLIYEAITQLSYP